MFGVERKTNIDQQPLSARSGRSQFLQSRHLKGCSIPIPTGRPTQPILGQDAASHCSVARHTGKHDISYNKSVIDRAF